MENELNTLFGLTKKSDLALSYSRLSDFDRNGPKALVKRTHVKGEGVRIGSLVDDLLLNKEKFDDIYYIYDGVKPTATLGKLCDIILENYKKPPSKKTVLKIIRKNKFWTRYKDETLDDRFNIPEFWDYIKHSFKSRNKVLVTTPDMELSLRLVDVLLTHKYSKDIFTNELTHYNQFKFTMDYKGFILRGIMDKVVIDHKNKTVRMIDLKTGQGASKKFIKSFMEWRYYLQEAVYTKAFKEVCKKLKLKGYTLLPFQFLYISRNEQVPLVFEISEKWHEGAINGFTTDSGYKYRGLHELLDEIQWHIDNKIFNVSKFTHESNGLTLLDDNFIILN
ncbi:MAG: PD-(D/E)XK nuclease family protein [Gammaproteobacteria bacterium]|nr:PD-(D/E)XK nuclease family protein [Gammaproteobacteria bacterium]